MGILVFALTFLIVLMIVLGVWMVASGDNKQEVVRRRMEAVRKAERRGDVSLGLTLARQIARAHGGDIVYQPREAGGSCFTVYLPVLPA